MSILHNLHLPLDLEDLYNDHIYGPNQDQEQVRIQFCEDNPYIQQINWIN